MDVRRPQQYTGGEWNSVSPRPGAPRVTLVYPDVYELGMSNFALSVLRQVLLDTGSFDVRRAFAPAPDMDAFISAGEFPWVDLDGWDPVIGSRVVGFTVPAESLYTNVLHLLRLMGLPLRSGDRSSGDPLVLLGGGGLANPLPLAPFADVIFLGEIEEQGGRLFEILAGGGSGDDRKRAAAEIPGVFVPSMGRRRVVFQRVRSLEAVTVPVRQLVPNSKVSQDRAVVEIARGCSRGCRFCQASQVYRPVRERSPENVCDLMDSVLHSTGWEKAGVLTLSLSDHSRLPELLDGLETVAAARHAEVSMPSMRPDTFLRMGTDRAVTGRLTLAPEAGTESLRNRINKPIDDEVILDTVKAAFAAGARGVKLYFMVGLPMETDDDVKGIGKLALRVSSICRGFGRNPRKSVSVALSPFVPKAGTPLQWAPQESEEEVWRRIGLVRRMVGKKVDLGWNSPRVARVEALLSLGDDGETADMLEEAVLAGARFDAWSDEFRWDVWKKVMGNHPEAVAAVNRGLDPASPLPWDFVSTGVSGKFLEEEYGRYMRGVVTPDCREGSCHGCGACGDGLQKADGFSPGKKASTSVSPAVRAEGGSESRAVLRVRYSKSGRGALTSHLDCVRMWGRILRRADLPVTWSGGYVKRPRIQFGPPLPLGMESIAEYVDIRLRELPGPGVADLLEGYFPEGFGVEGAWILHPWAESPDKPPLAALYSVTSPEGAGVADGLVRKLRNMSSVMDVRRDPGGEVKFMVPAGTRESRPDVLLKDEIHRLVSVKRIEVFHKAEGDSWKSLESVAVGLEMESVES